MKVKVFNIRLAKEFCLDDQEKLNAFLENVEVKLTSTNFVTTGSIDYWSIVIFYIEKQPKKDKIRDDLSTQSISHHETVVFQALKLWRNEMAKKLGWSPYRICHNSHLMALAKANPQNVEALEMVPGFGKTRTDNYGEAILSVLKSTEL
jgi:ribonuclease D